MGADDCFDQGAVDASGAGNPRRGIGRRHDLLAAALVTQRDWNVD
jgi:hypothetical protein